MAHERVKLQVDARDANGSANARRLRASGFIPGVLYGEGKDAVPFSVAERELRRVLSGEHGRHAILDVVVGGDGGKPHHAVLKDFQVHPTRGRLLHVDLHEVRLDRPIQATVVVELTGEPEGVTMGGVLTQINREVNVEALPMEIPDRLELDVSGLQIGDSLRVSDLHVPEGVTLLDDEETVLASVAQPRVEEEPEVEEEEEGVEGEVPEGEEPGEAPEGAEPAAEEAAAEQDSSEG